MSSAFLLVTIAVAVPMGLCTMFCAVDAPWPDNLGARLLVGFLAGFAFIEMLNAFVWLAFRVAG